MTTSGKKNMKLITTPETISRSRSADVDQPEQVGAQPQREAVNHIQDVGPTQVQPEDRQPDDRQHGGECALEELLASGVDVLR